MKPLEMDVYMDRVEIEGQIVNRPDSIQRSWWMSVWGAIANDVIGYREKQCPHCGRYS